MTLSGRKLDKWSISSSLIKRLGDVPIVCPTPKINMFDSLPLCYHDFGIFWHYWGCPFWHKLMTDKIEKEQKKASSTMSFSDLRASSSPLFKENKKMKWKMKEIVEMQNTLLVHSFLKGKLPGSFEFFQKSSNVHSKPTRFSSS